MTKIRFSGFPEDSTVTLSASKGGVTKGPVSISAWQREPVVEQATPAAMTIRVFNWKPGTPAPASIWFEAEVTGDTGLPARVNGDVTPDAIYDDYDQQFHELDFEWSFGDTGVWHYAERLPEQLQQRDYGHGKIVNHVYATPGNKTVTCWAYRMGVDGSGNLTRTLVASANVTFADGGDYPAIPSLEEAIPLSRRIYFNPEGDYSDVPAGAVTGASLSENTIVNAFIWASNQSPSPAAVLMRRGTASVKTGQRSLRSENGNLYVGAYGEGPRPILLEGGFGSSAENFQGAMRSGYYIVNGIEVIRNWDPVTETGETGTGGFGGEGITHHLMYDCVIRNSGGNAVSFQLNSGQGCEIGERSMTICDTLIEGWRDYGMMVRGNSKLAFRQDFSVLGSAVRQVPNASIGTLGEKDSKNAHGAIRVANVHHLMIRASDLYVRHSWDSKVQACIRADMNSAQQWGEVPGRTIIYGTACEGGNAQILSAGAGGTNNPGGVLDLPTPETKGRAHVWPKNTLVKHNLMLGAWSVSLAAPLSKTCVSIIENVAVRPNVKTWVPNNSDDNRGQDWGIAITEVTNPSNQNGWVPGGNDEVAQNPARIIGNLTIDLKATTRTADERTLDNIAVVNENCLGLVERRDNTIYAPDYGANPVTDTGPWVHVRDIAPRETYGIRHDNEVGGGQTASMTNNIRLDGIFDEDPSYATPVDGLKLYRPASDAAVAGAATGPMSHRDFFGTVRTAGVPASQGAIEPAR
jgi:hypothetical protein